MVSLMAAPFPTPPPWIVLGESYSTLVIRILSEPRNGSVYAIAARVPSDRDPGPKTSVCRSMSKLSAPHLELGDPSVFPYHDIRLEYVVAVPTGAASKLIKSSGDKLKRIKQTSFSRPLFVDKAYVLGVIEPGSGDVRMLQKAHLLFTFLLAKEGVGQQSIPNLLSFLDTDTRFGVGHAARWISPDTPQNDLRMASGLAVSHEFDDNGGVAKNGFPRLKDVTKRLFFASLVSEDARMHPFGHPSTYFESDMTKTNARFGGMTAHMLALDPAKSLSLDPVFFRAYHYYLGPRMAQLAAEAAALPVDTRPPLDSVGVYTGTPLSDAAVVYFVGAPFESRDVRTRAGEYLLELRLTDGAAQRVAIVYEGDTAAHSMIKINAGDLQDFAARRRTTHAPEFAVETNATYKVNTTKVDEQKMMMKDRKTRPDLWGAGSVEWNRVIKLEYVNGERLGLPVECAAFSALVWRKRVPQAFVRVRTEADYHSERLRVLSAYTKELLFFDSWANEALERFKTEQGM